MYTGAGWYQSAAMVALEKQENAASVCDILCHPDDSILSPARRKRSWDNFGTKLLCTTKVLLLNETVEQCQQQRSEPCAILHIVEHDSWYELQLEAQASVSTVAEPVQGHLERYGGRKSARHAQDTPTRARVSEVQQGSRNCGCRNSSNCTRTKHQCQTNIAFPPSGLRRVNYRKV